MSAPHGPRRPRAWSVLIFSCLARFLPLSLALATSLLCGACGPSLTTVHEGTIRFEHCYRLDLETSATATQRRACWGLWLESYTYGQSRDRIEYARRRLNAIADESQQPPELRLAGDRPPEQRQFYLVVP